MRIWRAGTVSVACIGLLLSIASVAVSAGGKQSAPKALTVCEARLLVYLLPEAHAMREEGFDANPAFERFQSSDSEYVFMLQAVVENPEGSVLLGYFGVNKFTGEIVERTTDERVGSKEIEGVLKILRWAQSRPDSCQE